MGHSDASLGPAVLDISKCQIQSLFVSLKPNIINMESNIPTQSKSQYSYLY